VHSWAVPVSVSVPLCVCVVCVCVSESVSVSVCVCLSVLRCASVSVWVCVRVPVCAALCQCVCAYVRACVCGQRQDTVDVSRPFCFAQRCKVCHKLDDQHMKEWLPQGWLKRASSEHVHSKQATFTTAACAPSL
jgi:hypothetical protein